MWEITSKPKAAIILEHRQQHGLFSVVEEILDAKKFDEQVFERLGRKIVKVYKDELSDELQDSQVSKKEKGSAVNKKLTKHIKPKLQDLDYDSEEINSIVGIKYSLHTLSYAHMDKNTNTILSWKHVPCFENASSKSEFVHPNFFETAMIIANEIPVADLFIFEEHLPIVASKNDPYLMIKGIFQNLRNTMSPWCN